MLATNKQTLTLMKNEGKLFKHLCRKAKIIQWKRENVLQTPVKWFKWEFPPVFTLNSSKKFNNVVAVCERKKAQTLRWGVCLNDIVWISNDFQLGGLALCPNIYIIFEWENFPFCWPNNRNKRFLMGSNYLMLRWYNLECKLNHRDEWIDLRPSVSIFTLVKAIQLMIVVLMNLCDENNLTFIYFNL